MVGGKNDTLLTPATQEAYWSSIDPDVRAFLDDFESREDWTYSYDEMPQVFVEISKALPKFAKFEINSESSATVQPMIRQLIKILSAMPLRQAISAISWLDQNVKNETDIGWGVAIYMEAAQIALFNKEDPMYKECKLLYERIDVMLHSTLSSLLFLKLRTLGE